MAEVLAARGDVTRIDDGDGDQPAGMAIQFTALDSENRERLLRFFVSARISTFYQDKFIREFPHLQSSMSLKDVALIVNLWEDRDDRVSQLHHQAEPPRKGRRPQRGR